MKKLLLVLIALLVLVSCQNTTQSETKDSAHLQLSTHEIVVEYGDEVNLRDYVISGEWDELLLPDFKADSLGEYELNIIAKKNGEEISKTLRIRVIETILQNENSSTINSGISGDEGENTSVSTPPQSGAPSSRPGGEGTNPSVSTPPQTEAHNNSPIGEGENTSVSTPPQSDAPSSEIAGESNTDTVDREEKLEFYMNAWENYKCGVYEKFGFWEDTGRCWDVESINATNIKVCTDGHVESNGKCEKMLNFAADYETVCINGGVMRNGDCWYPQPTKTHAIGVCPSGYKYYRAGFGGEIGYCKDFTNNVKTEATFTCDGIVSVDNPKLAITSTHAYCEGNSWSFLDPNNQPLSKLEYSCPAGYTVDGSRCIGIHTQEMDTEFSCPYGYSVIPYGSFAMCGPIENIRKDTLTIEYYCPKDGFKNLILQGNKCYIEKSH